MSFAPLPATACWQHRAARSGFEVAYFQAAPGGWRMDGTTAAVEDGQTWIVSYSIRLDAAWITREARVTARTASGLRETLLACDGEGRWRVDGRVATHLDGCLDVDLESSALTNTLPVHRLELATGIAPDAGRVRPCARPARRTPGTELRAAARRGRAPALPLCRSRFRLHLHSGLRRERPGPGLPGHRSPGRLTRPRI